VGMTGEKVVSVIIFNTMHIQKRSISILVAIVISILIMLVSYFRVFEVFELATLDVRFKSRPLQKVSDNIVIIEIAKDTLDQIGTWPIDREFHAYLIDILTRFNAHYIIFDMIFSKEQTPASDEKLIKAVRESQKVYMPLAFRLSSERVGFPKATEIESATLPELEKVSRGVAHINILNDIDGKRRRVPLFVQYEGKLYPQLSLLVACDYLGKKTDEVDIPIDDEGMTLINFAGKWGEAFKHYSFIDILKSDAQIKNGQTPRIDLNRLKDKICIIGLTAAGTHDLQPTSIQSNYPMVGVHANIINSILNDSFISRVSKRINIAILLLLAFITGFLVLRLKPLQSILWVLGLLFSFTVFSFLIFTFFNIWIDLFYPILLIALVYLFSTFYKYITERNKRMLMEKELDIAKRIQKSFLKETPPVKDGLEIAVRMDTAKAVGGDLYDFIDMPDDKIGIMIGDVSGKGVPAALFMAKTVSEFRFHSRMQAKTTQVMVELNNLISIESTSGLFVTICYVVVDLKEKLLHIIDAGHLPVIAAHKDKPTETLQVEGAMAVGIMDGIEYTEKSIPFENGDTFLLYTDGVTEARNIKKEEFEEGRIMQLLSALKTKPAAEIIEGLFKNIHKFQGRAPQHDDITVIAIKII